MAEELEDDESQRGPGSAAKKVYKTRAPQKFMEEIIATGKYVISTDETTGQGVFVGQFNPISYKTESGKDVALVLFEVFLADESVCCKAPTKRKKTNGVFGPHICKECGQECQVKQDYIRKPTYIPNPRTGSRVAIWNQCIVQWSLIPKVIEGMTTLHIGSAQIKKEEIIAAKGIIEEKQLTSLRRFGI
jgi:hypothetical protein